MERRDFEKGHRRHPDRVARLRMREQPARAAADTPHIAFERPHEHVGVEEQHGGRYDRLMS